MRKGNNWFLVCFIFALFTAFSFVLLNLCGVLDDDSFIGGNFSPFIENIHEENSLDYDFFDVIHDNDYLDPIDIRTINARSGTDLETISLYGQTESIVINQTDYFGNNALIEIERIREGDNYRYFLSDALRNINVLNNIKDSKGRPQTAGTLISEIRAVGESADNIFSDYVAVSIFINLVKSWDFFASAENIGVALLGSDPNNQSNNIRCDATVSGEREIVALVHYDTEWENAGYLYDGQINPLKDILCFGDGKIETFFNLGTALDVVGHEYQHAVTNKINPLIYSGESGTLNEAYSDVFGMLIQDYDMDDVRFWLMGEDIASENKGGCIRDISNPVRMGHPSHVSEKYVDPTGKNTNKVVHLNSNIITHALYNMYLNADMNNLTFFTKKLIGKLYYKALAQLSKNAKFSEFRYYLIETADNIELREDDVIHLKELIAYGFEAVGIEDDNIEYPYITETLIIVTYYGKNGEQLSSGSVSKLENSLAPSVTKSFYDGIYHYEFEKWDKEELGNGDVIFRAVYKKSISLMTIGIIMAFFVCLVLDILVISFIINFKRKSNRMPRIVKQ